MRRSSRTANAPSARAVNRATTATATPPTATAAAMPPTAPLSAASSSTTNATIAIVGPSSAMATAGSMGTPTAGGTPSAGTETAATSSPVPMTVHNVPPITFHEKDERLFMDDKHIDATHAQHVPITRAQVENLGQQFRQHATTWPGVPIPFQQYFSQKAQAAIEDYILLKDIVNVGNVWTKPWPILIDVLRQMYPESAVTEKDAITLSKIALIDFMIDNISNDTSWHKWKPTSKETLVSQQMSLLRAARKIFEEQGVPRENHGELLTNPALLGGECVKAF